jgi:hypothetical protein
VRHAGSRASSAIEPRRATRYAEGRKHASRHIYSIASLDAPLRLQAGKYLPVEADTLFVKQAGDDPIEGVRIRLHDRQRDLGDLALGEAW